MQSGQRETAEAAGKPPQWHSAGAEDTIKDHRSIVQGFILCCSHHSKDLVQDAGEGAGRVAFEGELAVLSRRALWAQPLEQHAGHPVPVAGPDGVSLQRDVGGRLEEGNMSVCSKTTFCRAA